MAMEASSPLGDGVGITVQIRRHTLIGRLVVLDAADNDACAESDGLRLFEVQVGRCRMSVVTNVLDDAQLSVEQARELYKLRWGIELQFRTLKQTFGRRKLRSKTPERAVVELDWSLLGLAMIQLF